MPWLETAAIVELLFYLTAHVEIKQTCMHDVYTVIASITRGGLMSKKHFAEYVLGHEGSSLLDFRVAEENFTVCVNAPGLLFTHLELRTSLQLQDGCDYAAIRSLADGFNAIAVCGHKPPTSVDIHVASSDVPFLRIGLGPPTMYMTRLQFTTKEDESFAALCDRVLKQARGTSYMVGLVPVLSRETGHGDHHAHKHEEAVVVPDEIATPRRRFRIERVLEGRGQ